MSTFLNDGFAADAAVAQADHNLPNAFNQVCINIDRSEIVDQYSHAQIMITI
jgi:hypothetical protein